VFPGLCTYKLGNIVGEKFIEFSTALGSCQNFHLNACIVSKVEDKGQILSGSFWPVSAAYHEFLSGSFQEKSNLPAKSPLTGPDMLRSPAPAHAPAPC